MKFDIGEMLKDYRLKNKLSQAEVGSQLGINSMTVSRMENGQTTRISNELISKILELLSLDMADVIKERADKINAEKERKESEAKSALTHALNEEIGQKKKIVSEALENLLGKLGYKRVRFETIGVPWMTYYNPQWDKSWIALFIPGELSGVSPAKDRLARYVGDASLTFYCLNGLSLIFEADNNQTLHDDLGTLRPTTVPYDLRILSFDFEENQFDDQITVHASYNGDGLFDIKDSRRDEEEREEILKEYGKFCASFNQ